MVTSKVGMSKSEHSSTQPPRVFTLLIIPPSLVPESTDQEFDDYQNNFALLEAAADKFLKDTKTFTNAVNSMCRLHSPLSRISNPLTRSFFRQRFLHPEAASRSISLSCSIRSLQSMTSSGNSLSRHTRSRTSTHITLLWRSCVHPSALNSS